MYCIKTTGKTPNKIFFTLLTLMLFVIAPASVWSVEFNLAAEEQIVNVEGPQIAVLLPLSGAFAEVGKMLKKGYILGFSAAADTLEIVEPQYIVKYLDSEANPETARTLINSISSEEDVIIATGTPLNATAWTTSRTCEKNHLPYLIVGADQDNLINNESNFTFRLTPEHSSLNQTLADFMATQEPEIQSTGIIYDNSPGALKRARQLRKLCSKQGIDLAIWEQWRQYRNNKDNFYDLLNLVKERQPQVLFLITKQTVAKRLWEQGKRLEIMPPATISIPVNCVTSDSKSSPETQPGVQLIYASQGSTPWLRLSDDENLTPASSTLLAQGFAAAKVISTCLKQSLDLTPEAIVKSMESININTIYNKVSFSNNNSGHQNPVSWYLSRNDATEGGIVVFPLPINEESNSLSEKKPE